MKKIHQYIMAVCLFSTAACSKSFLDTEDVTNATEQNFYKTPNDAYKALVGAYDGLQRVWADGVALPLAAEILSDNAFGGTGNSDGFGFQLLDEFDKLRSPADQNMYGGNWIAYYKAIYRCNMLLGKIDEIDFKGDEELRMQYTAEARFIRAYLYFDMVRLWGNIPLLTAPSTENLPPASADEVYQVLTEDLVFAAENLPAIARPDQPAASFGRVTRWAAASMIGRVYLYYTGYYGKADLVGLVSKAQALGYLEEVIAGSGHELVADFSHLWPAASLDDFAGEDNLETIFSIRYTYTSDYDGNTDGNHWMVMMGMREQSSFPYGNGWGGSTVNPKLWNAFSATDTRKSASIISITDEEIDFTMKANQREYTGFYNKKYSPMSDEAGNSLAVKLGAVNFMIGQFQDYTAIRYADVLLMAAELGAANAQGYFDAVRQRAYGNNFTALTVSQENIIKERRLEFAGEGIRYWDLLRQGIDAAAAAIAESTTVENGGVVTAKTIVAEKIKQTMGLQQIPNTQITLSNNVLVQNAGW